MSRDYVLHPFRAPVELHIDYARELNEQQYAAVTAVPGPSLVIAGAGSGKTRTLTYRVAFLLEQGVPADRILLLTFTNKAAREMMRRVADLLGSELSDLWGGTFHSIGARMLRRHAELLGFRNDFTILDRDDSIDLLKACVGAADIDVTATRCPKPEVIAEILSSAINTQRSIAQVIGEERNEFSPLTPLIAGVGRRYAERKKDANLMDFDDLLALWLKLLQEHDEVRDRYQRKFQFVLVDEYQDTNKLQADLIDLLAERTRNVMAVGDDCQSIYSWRGANFRNILDFPKRYPGTAIYKIETNYRSTPEILAVANAAIAGNENQFKKELAAAKKSGIKPILVACHNSAEQAGFVAQRVLELREEGQDLNNIAVLYRSHFHALELQLELTRRNIPFTITSGTRFFEQAHIKDLAAFLKLVINPADELSFKRLVQMLPGIGPKAAENLWNEFRARWQGRPAEGKTPVAAALQGCVKAVPKKCAVAWTQFAITLSQMEDEPARSKPAEMIRIAREGQYEDYVEDTFPNARSRLEDLAQLESFAGQFSSPEDFLTQVALLTNVEAESERTAAREDEMIRLTTVHQAKGLEFDVVFVIMLCEGLFPSARSGERPESLEEERRLFYVAITRARNELYLSFPIIRATPGMAGESMQRPSRFVNEIPREIIEEWNLRSYSSFG